MAALRTNPATLTQTIDITSENYYSSSTTLCHLRRERFDMNKTRVRTIVTIGLSLRPIVALSDDYRSR